MYRGIIVRRHSAYSITNVENEVFNVTRSFVDLETNKEVFYMFVAKFSVVI